MTFSCHQPKVRHIFRNESKSFVNTASLTHRSFLADVQYTDGYIRGPGYIDLSGLTFTTLISSYGDDIFGDGKARRRRRLDAGIEQGASTVDIAVFHLPQHCASSRSGCDWTKLGVGGKLDDGTLRWCCSQDAIDYGLCHENRFGRLIINGFIFSGSHRFVNVPPEGPMSKQIRYGKLEEFESGQYVVVFANCNENGREIKVLGECVWKSKHGYLPGELFGFMYFYAVLTAIYLVLVVWYGYLMHKYEDSRIPIEKWIFMTISMGALEMLFRTGDHFVWNEDGYRMNLAVYVGILMGVLKRGISRCLIVMVSLGWGVVRDSLGTTMRTIIVLGATYIGVSAACDLMLVFAVEDMQTLSVEQEVKLFDVVKILTFIIAAIDVIFILWILDALNGTMQYLENMSQTRKLMRYLRLRCIFLFSLLFAAVWVVFELVDNYDEDGIVREEHEWVVDAATEVNYLFVLIGVAILWRPNPNAKEYAYVMELPALGGEGETELELTGVVPSAMDDDDEEPTSGKNGFHDNPKGYHDDPDHHDERFQIDDGEAT